MGVGGIVPAHAHPRPRGQGMKNALAVLGQSVDEGRVIDHPDLLVPFGKLNDLMGITGAACWRRRTLFSDDKTRGLDAG